MATAIPEETATRPVVARADVVAAWKTEQTDFESIELAEDGSFSSHLHERPFSAGTWVVEGDRLLLRSPAYGETTITLTGRDGDKLLVAVDDKPGSWTLIPARPSAPTPNYDPPADCAASVAELEKTMDSLKPLLPKIPARLPSARAKLPVEPGHIVVIGKDGVTFAHLPMPTRATLARALKKRVRKGQLVYFYVDADLAATRVTELAQAVPKHATLHLAAFGTSFPFDRLQPKTEWGRYVIEHARSLSATERATFFVDAVAAAIGTCAPLSRAFATRSSRGAHQQFQANVYAAIAECQCKGMDIDGFSTLMAYGMSEWNYIGYLPLANVAEVVKKLAPEADIGDLAKALAAQE